MGSFVRKSIFSSLAILSAALAPAPAMAGAIVTGFDALHDWNLIVLGNSYSTSTVAGRTFIGGNLTGSGGYAYSGVGKSSAGWGGLTVVGNIGGGTNSIFGDTTIGGNVTTQMNYNANFGKITVDVGGTSPTNNVNGNTLNTGLSSDPAFLTNLNAQRDALTTSLGTLSGSLAGLSDTNSVLFGNNTATFNAVADSNGVAVFSLTAAQLGSVGQIQFNRNGVDTVIVNVSGSNVALAQNFLGDKTGLSGHVIWNMSEATTLNVGAQGFGSYLAPKAQTSMTSAIDGTLVALGLQQTAQIHLNTYQGIADPFSSPNGVPEPATWAMMVLGFGMVGGTLRASRRRMAMRLAA